jgi:SAM-dependent methyltransferase
MTHPSAHRIIDLYESNAENWDRERGKKLIEKAWIDRFVGLLAPGATVLDVGCGSGDPIATYLVGQGHAVTGVDASPAMVALCARRFPAHTWITADMRTMDLGLTFAGLLAWDSLFHLTPDDQERMFAVFARHAATGTALMFTSGPRHGEAISSWRGEDLYHASLAPEAYRARLDAAGFDVVAHAVEDAACGGHTVWLAQRRA